MIQDIELAIKENQLGDECYQNGDTEGAIQHWQKAYDLGLKEAGYHLANRYYYGEGVERDFDKSFKYFLECAMLDGDDGYIMQSQFNTANAYYNGEGVERDIDKAYQWYLKAADSGHPSAQFNIGISYYKGIYFEQDFEKAFYYMKEASLNDVAPAQYVMGTMLLAGHGVDRNVEMAKKLFELAAENGDTNAVNVLKQMELDEKKQRELEEMKSKFKNVMEVADPSEIKDIKYVTLDNVCDVVNELEGENEVVYEDIQEGLTFEEIQELAEEGHPKALNILGEYYIDEENEDYDLKKAFGYFTRAAAKEDPNGLYNLGVCFINGEGVAQDLMMGMSRITKAAELGSLKACQFLFQVYSSSGDFDKAISFIEMAIGYGDMDAAFDLAAMYEDGDFGEVDLEKALKYYKICANSGDEEAMGKVNELEEKLK